MDEHDYPSIAISHLEAGIALVDSVGKVIWANPKFKELHSEDPTFLAKGDIGPEPSVEEVSIGAVRWKISTKPLHGELYPNVSGLIEISPVHPSFEAKTGENQPFHHSDPLTGVLSRSSFEAELARWNDAAHEHPFALLFLDLDRFKQINDRYGHLEGDACLREIGSRLQGALRSGDVVGRYGGDGFCLLIAGVTTEKELLPLSSRLQQAVKQNYTLPDGEEQIGVSLGWSFSKPLATPEELLHEADRAMYAQKRICPS